MQEVRCRCLVCCGLISPPPPTAPSQSAPPAPLARSPQPFAPPVSPPPHYPESLGIIGLCPERSSYGGTYMAQGAAANGAPYYADGNGHWLYHDPDCNGAGSLPTRWILDICGCPIWDLLCVSAP
eukprot:7391143-Prymnesium_polylepis.2